MELVEKFRINHDSNINCDRFWWDPDDPEKFFINLSLGHYCDLCIDTWIWSLKDWLYYRSRANARFLDYEVKHAKRMLTALEDYRATRPEAVRRLA